MTEFRNLHHVADVSAPVPNYEPSQIYAGDTVKFTKTLPQFSATDGWTLSYTFRNREKKLVSEGMTVDGSGTQYTVTIPADTTEKWTPGRYNWLAYVASGSERYLIGKSYFDVLPDPEKDQGVDERTHAERMLDALELALEGSAGSDIVEYTIGGRSVKRSRKEVLEMRREYAWEVARQRGTAPTYYGATFRRS